MIQVRNVRPTRKLELGHPAPVCGVDEAGRGPLAGPVVAAAVILPAAKVPRGIDDSKKLCATARADLSGRIYKVAIVGVGMASVEEIDAINIYHATMLAMARAVEALGVSPGMVLVDGNAKPKWLHACVPIVGGDALCLSIAAASIVAKHHRDAIMIEMDRAHPGYGWARNKGYGSRDHRAALMDLGPTAHHRRSFGPVQEALRAR